MRIKEEFKRKGNFWLPSEPERKILGTLSISDGGRVELEVDGQLGTSIDNLERIVGYIQKGTSIISTPVTLDDCYYKKISLSGNSPSLIQVSKVFKGLQYGENEIPRFNTLSFSVEGIDDWIPITGLRVEDNDKTGTPTTSYDQPADFSLKLENGMELRIIWRSSWKYAVTKEAVIREKRYFQLYSTDACELDDFISIARKITEFLCFAINKTVSVDSMSATSKDLPEKDIGDGKTWLKPINIYYQSWLYSKEEPKIDWYSMLFKFTDIQDDTERIINSWINAYEQIAPAFRLYFLAKLGSQTYMEERFLTLAQGLEACNEKISNVSNLKDSITDIIKPFKDFFGNNQQRDKLIEKIVDTRNYLTHHNPRKKQKAAKGKDLWILCLKMEVLFEFHLLKLIGFSEKEIKSIVNNCSDFKYKLLSS